MLSSCEDRMEQEAGGSGIRFSATSGFGLVTKTQYSGGYVSTGDRERIDWLSGDGLTILSPQAQLVNKNTNPWTVSYSSSSPQYSVADYRTSGAGTAEGVYSTAGIVNADENDLHWGSGAHLFYGVYPMLSSLPSEVQSHVGITTNAGGSKGIISAYIPKAQTYSSVANGGKSRKNASVDSTHVYPQMEYAWMYSAQYAPEAGKDVKMFFSPMITTFQIAVAGIGDSDIPITRFELFSEGSPLQGEFTAEVSVTGGNTVITRDNHSSSMLVSYSGIGSLVAGGNDLVTFTLPSGTAVSGSKKVTFTVFVYPRGTNGAVTLSGLTVRFVSSGVTRSLKLKDSSNGWVAFPAGKKINIDGLTLPRQDEPWTFTVIGEDWEEELSDVVINPVQITEYENQEGGNLDDRAYVLDVDWENLTLDEAGGVKADFATVKSYKDNAAKTPVPYQLEYYDGSQWKVWDSNAPAWLTMSAPASGYAGSYSGDALGVTMAAQVNSATDAHRSAMIAKGSYSTAFDLSTRNVATGETVSKTTANCYVADRPGKYKFPLVYGNGVKDGAANAGAYEQSLTTNSGYLTKFLDHKDNNITSPYIATQHSGKTLTAAVLWCEYPGLVTDVSITGSGSSAYLNFTVPAENITQGNAVVAVLANGEVAWSWHIWVTDQNLAISENMDPYAGSNNNVFAPVNLGWSDAITRTYAARSCSLRVVQPVSGLESSHVLIDQPYASYTVHGRNPFYQWGRKDPFTAGTAYGDQAYTPNLAASGPVSLGAAIQHPWNNYISGATTDNWCSDTWYNLWNTNLTYYGSGQFATEVIKTVYDPSPVGYMVPPQNAYSGFTTSNCTVQNASAGNSSAAVVYNSSSLRFPLTGYLAATDGSHVYNGQVSHHWSAVPYNSIQAYPLTTRYTSGIVNTTSPLGRSYAVSVRPVLEEVSEPIEAQDGCFVVSILQDTFSAAGGTSTIEICSSAFTVSNGYYSSCAPGLPWRVAGFSTDRTTWSTTPPSWFSISRMSGRPVADEDVQFNFTVASASSGTKRFVMVKFVQEASGQAIVLYISQGATASSASWSTNMMFGSDNSICGGGNTILGSGNFIMGYDNRSEGTGNVSVGYENQSIGNNNYSIGTGNYNRGTGNTCVGDYNTCWGSYNICGSSWNYAWEKIVIGDSNWISWFGS